MKATLLNIPTREFIDSAIGQCWNKGPYGTDEAGLERIDRICNKFKHASMLRFTNYIFELEMSTSSLLEFSRHRVGINLAVMSTRYCTKQNPELITFEQSGNTAVNQLLDSHLQDILKLKR